MLHAIAFITAISVIGTGLYVLKFGDWRPFMLKFAGICISTLAAIYMLVTTLIIEGNFDYCTQNTAASLCMTFEIYYIARNLALIIFHIAIGRDAIHYKKHERRGTACRQNSSKQSFP